MERGQEFWLPSPQGEELGMSAFRIGIQQRRETYVAIK